MQTKIPRFILAQSGLGVEQSAQYEFPSTFLIRCDASSAYTFFVLADWLDLSTSDLARDCNFAFEFLNASAVAF